MRNAAPTRFGTAVSQNFSDSDSPASTLSTTIVHSTQMLKPMCSAKIEKIRFLRAIRLPSAAQNGGSSGSQRSIDRPLLRMLLFMRRTVGTAACAAVGRPVGTCATDLRRAVEREPDGSY